MRSSLLSHEGPAAPASPADRSSSMGPDTPVFIFCTQLGAVAYLRGVALDSAVPRHSPPHPAPPSTLPAGFGFGQAQSRKLGHQAPSRLHELVISYTSGALSCYCIVALRLRSRIRVTRYPYPKSHMQGKREKAIAAWSRAVWSGVAWPGVAWSRAGQSGQPTGEMQGGSVQLS